MSGREAFAGGGGARGVLSGAPYVLLDDARPGGVSRLYRGPLEIVTAATIDDVPDALERIRAATARGMHAAGYLTYEAGAAFVPGLDLPAGDGPVLWFGLFDVYATIDDVGALLPDPTGAWIGAPQPAIDFSAYQTQVARVLALIAAGDVYQANLTFAATVPVCGDAAAAFARLRRVAGAGYGALIDTGDRSILSLSPELFFALAGDAITCRPMKGTARRTDPAADAATTAALASDPKQRAENLMIVDLMRNDLSRVAVPSSVTVPALYDVETYPTVHQMTSTVTATLARDRDAIDLLAALYPCGSITGTPKRRAMQVIGAIEDRPRGVYCGAIGRIDATGDAMFNVAIRTLTIRDGQATIGLGSGIVADSVAEQEWDECLAKGAFLTADDRRPIDLIETMAFDPQSGIQRLDLHLARMQASATALGFAFDRHMARNELQAATFRLRGPKRVRLLLGRSGAIAIQVGSLPSHVETMTLAVVALPVSPGDFRLRHKTSDRGFYDDARRLSGADEVVFERLDGRLTEGSFTSLFVDRGDGILVTPPASDVLLPGVLRAALIADGRAVEGVVTRDDLKSAEVFVGNALRGLVRAAPVASPATAGHSAPRAVP